MAETHWKKLANPNYLGSWDFQKGEERILTISRIVQEEVFNPSDNSKKSCIVAHFFENSKPMVLNKTNCKMIQTLYKTPTIEKWSGRKIIITVEKVRAFGKLEDALRVKDEVPAVNTQSENVGMQCKDCGKEIVGFGGYSAIQIAKVNRKRYGIDLCADCSNKRKPIQSEESNNEANK